MDNQVQNMDMQLAKLKTLYEEEQKQNARNAKGMGIVSPSHEGQTFLSHSLSPVCVYMRMRARICVCVRKRARSLWLCARVRATSVHLLVRELST